MKNLREALEKYKRNKMSKATFEDDYMEGFQDCADLLFPLVEALELCASPYSSEHKERVALQALAEFKKFKGNK